MHDCRGENLTLVEGLDDPETRIWYAEQVIAQGWPRPILAMNIQRQLHKRAGRKSVTRTPSRR